jgi:hypothetical protein
MTAGVTVLTPDKTDFVSETATREKDNLYVMICGSVHRGNIAIPSSDGFEIS